MGSLTTSITNIFRLTPGTDQIAMEIVTIKLSDTDSKTIPIMIIFKLLENPWKSPNCPGYYHHVDSCHVEAKTTSMMKIKLLKHPRDIPNCDGHCPFIILKQHKIQNPTQREDFLAARTTIEQFNFSWTLST